jgi:23S rRNA A2030 N6-methylase RlmJ
VAKSSSKPYDHHEKAGNRGDVFKHVALIAALNKTVASTRQIPFKYADVFAGYAMNLLLPGKGEWIMGISKIAGMNLLKGNPHVALWARCWLTADRRVGSAYPGSSWFAKETCIHQQKKIEMWLWDTQSEPEQPVRTSQGLRMLISSLLTLPTRSSGRKFTSW